MQKNTLLFDFDLTLADSSQGIFKCINYALNKMYINTLEYERIKRTIGLSLSDTFKLLTKDTSQERAMQFTSYFVEKADEIMNDNTKVFPVVFELMPKIKEMGFKTGIVSTKYGYRIEGVLKRDNLSPFFDLVVGGDAVKHHKPNPEGLLLAISRLESSLQDVLYIGDALVDAEAARHAEIDFLAVLTGTVSRESFELQNFLHSIDNLTQLLDFIHQHYT